jgi:hypothetical protein
VAVAVPHPLPLIQSPPPPGSAYRVVGNQLLDPQGSPFVPYGFIVWCLSAPAERCLVDGPTDDQKIEASATFWHANVVRIQLAPERLFDQRPFDAAYLSQVDCEVTLANRLGLVAIISLQEQRLGSSNLLPSAPDAPFWTLMAQHFAGNPDVMFDLFTEPHATAADVGSEAALWILWRSGGTATIAGRTETWVGMQTLVDDVRATGATNVVIADGPAVDHDLQALPQAALIGGNVAYGFEPDLVTGDTSSAQWSANFGGPAQTYPLVMDAFQDYPAGSTCNASSSRLFPELVAYLRALHLGLVVFSLDPGVLEVGGNLEDPTSLTGSVTMECTRTGLPFQDPDNAVGVGADVLAWFSAAN